MDRIGIDETGRLGTGSVGRLLVRMALPSVVAQLINLLYSMVDRIYIGHIPGTGPLALTGVGLFSPVTSLTTGFAALVCTGGAPMMAMALGRGDREKASRALGSCFSALIAIGTLFMTVLLIWAPGMLRFFGASGSTLPYGLSYMRICSLGTVFSMIGVGLNLFISSQGFSMTAMGSTVMGAMINIILDPVLIFALDMGVSGAALATVISQAVSAFRIVGFLLGRRCTVRLERKTMKPDPRILKECMALGSSSFIMFSTEGLLSMAFTRSLARYGADLAVGAMTIMTSTKAFQMNVLQGMVQGAQPVLSYNFGAGDRDRVRRAFSLIFASTMTYSLLFWAVVLSIPEKIAGAFTTDRELIEYTVRSMKVFFAMSFITGAQMACQHSFVALGQAGRSLLLALFRKIVLLIPMIMILPSFFPGREVFAVFLSEPVCDTVAAAVTTLVFLLWFEKAMGRRS